MDSAGSELDGSDPTRRRRPRSYLLNSAYRQISLSSLPQEDAAALELLEQHRWGAYGSNVQACPHCGRVDSHYRYRSRSIWKCREILCGKQFSVLTGSRLHGLKIRPSQLLAMLLQFVEAKDSISAREVSGLYDVHYQTAHALLMKIRETLRETQAAEPKLSGRIQADAAYFIRYRRPGNVGTKRALSGKAEQKNAGLNEHGKVEGARHAKDMHALVLFVQTGPQTKRRYKIGLAKTEEQAKMDEFADDFCERGSRIWTDQMRGYFVLAQEFEHQYVNHSERFMTLEGVHTNFAENFFSRMRAAQWGAWHRLTIQHLLEYGWECAWRLTMAGHNNEYQLRDLLGRLLSAGRGTRFVRGSGRSKSGDKGSAEQGTLVEVDKATLQKARGRPRKGVIRVLEEPRKRPYRRKAPAAPLATPEGPVAEAPSLLGSAVKVEAR